MWNSDQAMSVYSSIEGLPDHERAFVDVAVDVITAKDVRLIAAEGDEDGEDGEVYLTPQECRTVAWALLDAADSLEARQLRQMREIPGH